MINIMYAVDPIKRIVKPMSGHAVTEQDHEASSLRFAFPDNIAGTGLDSTGTAVRVMYIRPDGGDPVAKTLTFYKHSGGYYLYDWNLQKSDLQKEGHLVFSLCILDISSGEVSEWHTTPCAVRVLSTIHTDDSDEGDDTVTPTVKERVAVLETMIQRVASGAPVVVASTSAMTDTDQIYVLSTDGEWYYHNGTAWVAGGEYGAVATDKSLTQDNIPADAKTVGDTIESLNNITGAVEAEVFDITRTTILDGTALTAKNTDVQISAVNGDVLKLSVTPNGKRVTVALCVGTSFVDDPTKYVIVSNTSESVSNLEYQITTEYKCLHIYASEVTDPKAVITAQLTHKESKVEPLTEAVSYMVEETITTVYDGDTITARNTDIVADVQTGDKIILSCTTNGNIVSFGLNAGPVYVSDPTKYKTVHGNTAINITNFEFDVDSGTWQSFHIWQSQANTDGIVVTLKVYRTKNKLDTIPVIDNTLSHHGQAADAGTVGDALADVEDTTDGLQDGIDTINGLLFDTVTYSIVNGTITNRNTDIVCDFQTGDILKVSLTPNGNTVTLALCVGTSFVDDPTKYVVLYNASGALSDREFSVSGEYKCLHIWHSTSTAINLTADRIRNQFITDAINADINALMKTRGRNFACFGDSITSEQVTGVGTAVSNLLECDLTGNFACGYAVCSNWHNGSTDTSPISLVTPQNANTADNVLMNQVLRCLQYTTAEGAQIKWTHPIAGEQSITTSYGTGLGHTDMYPDILYIAIGINDGNNSQNTFTDDADTVMLSSYANLTKLSLASALRWAIETLQSAYPNAQVFVASPLFTTSNDPTNNGQKSRGAVIAKRECIKKIANYCNAVFIDSTYESGYTVMAANVVGDLHPNARYKAIISKYVANEIRTRLPVE